jgi:hypothetical protein
MDARRFGVRRSSNVADSRIFTLESSRALSCHRNPTNPTKRIQVIDATGSILVGLPQKPDKKPDKSLWIELQWWPGTVCNKPLMQVFGRDC